jgi:hypothetical protein
MILRTDILMFQEFLVGKSLEKQHSQDGLQRRDDEPVDAGRYARCYSAVRVISTEYLPSEFREW